MRVFITGSNGFVGSRLMFLFEEQGYEVVGIDRDPDTPNPKHEKTILADLNIPSQLMQVTGHIDLIIHCAAAKSDFGVSNKEYHVDNVKATEALMEYALAREIKQVIYYSTVSVYGHKPEPTDETATLDSNTIYGDTKLEGEWVVKRWLDVDEDHKAIILRPSVIYGPGNYANMYNLLDTLHRRPYFMIGKGNHIKSMVAISNLVELTLFLTKRGIDQRLQEYNCIDKPYLSVKELMLYVAEEDGFSLPRVNIPIWLAYLLATPLEVLSRLSGKDLKVNWNRLKKFTTATDYRAEKIRNEGYVQNYSTKNEIQSMARWYKSVN